MPLADLSRARVAPGALALAFGLAVAAPAAAAPRERLALRRVEIPLPAPPSTVVAADLDGDGRRDLAVVVARTDWSEIATTESTRMDDVDGLVEVLTVVPALFDRRELHLFLARGDGFERAAPAFELGPEVLSLEAGPPGLPLLALLDDGLAAVRLEAGALRLEPLVAVRSLLAGSRTFVPGLDLVRDLDGDGRAEVLVPTLDGARLFAVDERGTLGGSTSLALPVDVGARGSTVRHPWPEVRDVDGDGALDLVVADPDDGWSAVRVLRGDGHRGFAPAVKALAEPRRNPAPAEDDDEESGEPGERRAHRVQVVHYGDLDGDGLAEAVTVEERSNDDAGMRESIAEAKRPPLRLRFYRTAGGARQTDLAALEPYAVLDAEGYGFEGSDPFPGGLQDLDGDGRLDLVTVTIDFSLLGAMRMMATHRISLGLDFQVFCQAADGRFRAVPGLDLSGKFRLDLDDLRLERIAQFAGDFDGDGRLDYVQLGRGRRIAIHRGRPGCAYPVAPDLELELRDEPRDLALVQVRDLDGDGLADLLVIQPETSPEPAVTAPVRLDLYLSAGAW